LTTQARSPNQAGRHRSHSIDNNAKKEPSPSRKSNTATNFYKPSGDDLRANDNKTDSGSKKRFDTAENEDSERVNQLETDVKSLRHDLASTKAKLEKTSFEKAQMKEEFNNLVHKVKSKGLQTNYVEKIKELSEQNENLTKENAKLTKNSKKLEQKADERKKNLKQLFELLEEKEKELGFYKTGPALGLTNHAERLEDLIKEKSLELESQYQAVEQQLKEKSEELDKLTSFITTISLKYNLLDGIDIDTATFRV
jgi:chromosome segregation ATPase